MKTYAVSLDLTVEAESAEQAWQYANAISGHLEDGVSDCGECMEKYKGCSAECGNISPADELDREQVDSPIVHNPNAICPKCDEPRKDCVCDEQDRGVIHNSDVVRNEDGDEVEAN